MKWEKFKDQFHESWHGHMQKFIESEACDKIYEQLKKDAKRGKKIAPLSSDTFRAFKLTPLNEVKVVLLGMCPYHTTRFDTIVADGLLMGCSHTGVLQPSLEQFYKGIEKELYDGLNLKDMKPADVSFLANQGVLMLNAALTTEINKAGSHIALWEPFTKWLFEEVLYTTGAPVIFLGKDAAKYKKYCAPFTWTFTLLHPAAAAYKGTEWDSEGTFTKVNKILKDNNGLTISWLDDCPF